MKKRIVIAGSVFFLLVFVFAVCWPPRRPTRKKCRKRPAKLMAKALEAIKQKQPDQAIDLLNQVMVLSRKTPWCIITWACCISKRA